MSHTNNHVFKRLLSIFGIKKFSVIKSIFEAQGFDKITRSKIDRWKKLDDDANVMPDYILTAFADELLKMSEQNKLVAYIENNDNEQ